MLRSTYKELLIYRAWATCGIFHASWIIGGRKRYFIPENLKSLAPAAWRWIVLVYHLQVSQWEPRKALPLVWYIINSTICVIRVKLKSYIYKFDYSKSLYRNWRYWFKSVCNIPRQLSPRARHQSLTSPHRSWKPHIWMRLCKQKTFQ